jgi:hypothetical protein
LLVGRAAYLVILDLFLCSDNVLDLGEGVGKIDVNKLRSIINDTSFLQDVLVDVLSMKQ